MELVDISIDELTRLMEAALVNDQVSEDEARDIAQCIAYAEMRGNNQGAIKLTSGALAQNPAALLAPVEEEHETPVSAKVAGNRYNDLHYPCLFSFPCAHTYAPPHSQNLTIATSVWLCWPK